MNGATSDPAAVTAACAVTGRRRHDVEIHGQRDNVADILRGLDQVSVGKKV